MAIPRNLRGSPTRLSAFSKAIVLVDRTPSLISTRMDRVFLLVIIGALAVLMTASLFAFGAIRYVAAFWRLACEPG